ncbi:hypothetical protein D1007_53917 [Hordeum vulgare]|nr:hypothetical protein D1007_53917 [Hordeum vulgare]
MSTTHYGLNHERVAPAPAVPADVDRQRVMLILGTLTASLSITAGLSPPGGARVIAAGDPLLHISFPQRYLAFVYCNSNASVFVASLAVILLVLLPRNIRVAMSLSLLGLITYVAVSCLSFMTSICVITLAAAVLLYIAIRLPVFLCNPVEISLKSAQETPPKCVEFIRPKRKMYLLRLALTKHNHPNIQHGDGDAYEILKKSRKHLLLFATLAASVTYQAGMNPAGSFWQGEATDSGDGNATFQHRRYFVFVCCNTSAFVMSIAILVTIALSNSTLGIRYYCGLKNAVTLVLFSLIGAYVARSLDLFSLVGAYVAGSIRQLYESVYMSMLVAWVSLYVVIHAVVFLLQVFLAWALWPQELREKMEHFLPSWLKKLFGLPTDEHADEEDDDDEEEEEEEEAEEEVVVMERKLERRRKLLLLLAILAAILPYHPSVMARPDNQASYLWLAFQYCKATVFIASLSIIAMLAKMKLPRARGVRWHALRVCVILDMMGLVGAFAAGRYKKISTIDVLVLVLAFLLWIVFHVTMSISGTRRGLVHSLLSMLGSSLDLNGEDPYIQIQDEGTQHDVEVGLSGGTNEEPLGLEIASPILGGALTMIVAIPVMSIVAIPVKLLTGFMIASIGVGLWRRSFARLFWALATALQRRQGSSTPPTGSGSSSSTPSTPREQLVRHGMFSLIHTLCSGTWMWILFLVIWVPSLRQNLKLRFKMSNISAALAVLVHSTHTTTSATAGGSTTTTATMDAPTATSAVEDTRNTTATVPRATNMSRGVQPLVQPRPRRNRRPNTLLIGPNWVN